MAATRTRSRDGARTKGHVTVLALDGGGIRGVIAAAVLAEIERRTRRPVSALFDLVAGTSTGGVIALGLTRPGRGGRPRYSAADLVALYELEGRTIFDRSLWHRLLALENLLEEKYPSHGLDRVLRRYFGSTMLSAATTEVLVPAYELERRQPWFFARWKARDPARTGWDFPMRTVARATVAAPTYFEPCRLAGEPPAGLVDGGLFANNPAMCAWAEARKLHPGADDILLVSLGTGQHTRPIHYDEARTWGLARWAQPAFACVMDGVSDTVDHQMRILCAEGPDGETRYYRFQTELDLGMDDFDDATRTNLLALRRKADGILEAQADDVAALCRQLAERASVPRSVRPGDLRAEDDELDPFFDHVPAPAPAREGDDSLHARRGG